MQFKILNRIWKLVWVKPHERPRTAGSSIADREWGGCEAPCTKGKRIFVRENQSDQELLDTLIHEQLHAAAWDMSEEWVHRAANDIARNILKVLRVERL